MQLVSIVLLIKIQLCLAGSHLLLLMWKWFKTRLSTIDSLTALRWNTICAWCLSDLGILKTVHFHRCSRMMEPIVTISSFEIWRERLSCLDRRNLFLYSAKAPRSVHRTFLQVSGENRSQSVSPDEFWVFWGMETILDSAKPAIVQKKIKT